MINIDNIDINNKIDRKKVPEDDFMPKLKLKKTEVVQLNNGITVIVIENHKLPVIKVRVEFDRPPILLGNKSGIEEIFSGMIRSGTKQYKKEEIDNIIDKLGGNLYTSFSVISLSSLKKYIDESIEILSDIILNSTFDNIQELEKLKKQEITNIKISEKDINSISERIRRFLTFGKNHPYGEFATEKTINNININDLKNFYRKYFIPNNAYVVFVGDISKSKALKLSKKYFSKWNKIEIKDNLNEIKYLNYKNDDLNPREIYFINMPHVTQANISIFRSLILNKNCDDYYSAIIANGILGGGIQSRICQNLREDKGYTYGAYSILEDDKYLGSFFTLAQVKTEATYNSIKEIIKEINNMSSFPVSDEELKIKKNEIWGKFILKLEDYNNIASMNINIYLEKLPKNFYQNYINNIKIVSINDILKTSKKYFDINKCKILVIGESSKILPQLKSLEYKINIIDKYGN